MLSLVITNSDCYDFSQLIIFPKEIPETGHPDFLSPDKPTGPGGRNLSSSLFFFSIHSFWIWREMHTYGD